MKYINIKTIDIYLDMFFMNIKIWAILDFNSK